MQRMELPTHTYRVTISNAGESYIGGITNQLETFPKYREAFLSSDMTTSRPGQAGSISFEFSCNHVVANALRKWFWRRHKGRAKFARQISVLTYSNLVAEYLGSEA